MVPDYAQWALYSCLHPPQRETTANGADRERSFRSVTSTLFQPPERSKIVPGPGFLEDFLLVPGAGGANAWFGSTAGADVAG